MSGVSSDPITLKQTIERETIERCARMIEDRFANAQAVSVTKGPEWTEETGNAELMNSQARRIASAIRALMPLPNGNGE